MSSQNKRYYLKGGGKVQIDQAIESLKNDQRRNYTQNESNLYKAQGLGLEALKRIQAYRKVIDIPCIKQLPGEDIKPILDSRRPDPRYPGILLLDD